MVLLISSHVGCNILTDISDCDRRTRQQRPAEPQCLRLTCSCARLSKISPIHNTNDYASVMSSLCHINAANADDDPAEAIIELERRPL